MVLVVAFIVVVVAAVAAATVAGAGASYPKLAQTPGFDQTSALTPVHCYAHIAAGPRVERPEHGPCCLFNG